MARRSVVRYLEPPHAPPPTRPSTGDLVQELRGVREAFRLALSFPGLRTLPRGRGQRVILIPGWKAPEASMTPLKQFLRLKGVAAEHWGMGTNQGDPERDSEALAARLAADGNRADSVILVGWSLGGVIAREVARAIPHRVARVITYGTPVIGGPTYTPAAGAYGEAECRRIRDRIDELDAASPITTPISAIFTRNDSIVSWPACIDRRSPNVRHFEVRSTHISMGIDPDVWELVLEQLQ